MRQGRPPGEGVDGRRRRRSPAGRTAAGRSPRSAARRAGCPGQRRADAADEGEGQAAEQGRRRRSAAPARAGAPRRDGGDRRGQRQRRAGGQPLARHLTAQVSSSGSRRQRQQVQRAVLEVALEQALERRAGRPAPAPPRRRRRRRPPAAPAPARWPAAAGWRRRRRSPRASSGPPPRPQASASLAAQQDGQARSRADLQRPGRDRQRIVHRGQDQAAAGQVRGHQLAEQGAASRRPAGASGSSSSHSGRGAATSRASARRRRWPAESRRTSRSEQPASAPASRPPPARPRRPPPLQRAWNSSSSRAVRAPASARPGGRPGAGRRRAPRPASGRRRRRSRPRSGGSSPATARSRLVLPAPLAPVSATASPAARRSGQSARTARRPPRRTANVSQLAGADHRQDRRSVGHGRARMDAYTLRVYESARPPSPGGPAPRGAGRCVSALESARSRDRFSGGREQREDLPHMASIDSLNTRRELMVGDKTYAYYSLRAAEEAGLSGVSPPAGLDEGAAGEPAAQRRRRLGRRATT